MFISREDEATLHGLNMGKLSIFWRRGNSIVFISREEEAVAGVPEVCGYI